MIKKNNSSFFKLLLKFGNEVFTRKIKSILLNLINIKKNPDWINSNYLKSNNVELGLKEKYIKIINE